MGWDGGMGDRESVYLREGPGEGGYKGGRGKATRVDVFGGIEERERRLVSQRGMLCIKFLICLFIFLEKVA